MAYGYYDRTIFRKPFPSCRLGTLGPAVRGPATAHGRRATGPRVCFV